MKPYRAWTLYGAGDKSGQYVEETWYLNNYDMIPDYWRHTLKDLAEYVGGI